MRRAPIASLTAAAALAPASNVSHPSTVKNLTGVICLSDFNILSDEGFPKFSAGKQQGSQLVRLYPSRYGVSPEWIQRTGEAHGAPT